MVQLFVIINWICCLLMQKINALYNCLYKILSFTSIAHLQIIQIYIYVKNNRYNLNV